MIKASVLGCSTIVAFLLLHWWALALLASAAFGVPILVAASRRRELAMVAMSLVMLVPTFLFMYSAVPYVLDITVGKRHEIAVR